MNYLSFAMGIIYGMWLGIFVKDRYINYHNDIIWFIIFSILVLVTSILIKDYINN
jgi:hypothetical protein